VRNIRGKRALTAFHHYQSCSAFLLTVSDDRDMGVACGCGPRVAEVTVCSREKYICFF